MVVTLGVGALEGFRGVEVKNGAGMSAAVSIEVGRVFDVPEAWLVRDAIQRAAEDARVLLDFRKTVELHEFALAVLIQALARQKRKLDVRGLSGHHRRLLRMLGAAVDEAPEQRVAG